MTEQTQMQTVAASQAAVLEKVIIAGDLKVLSPEQRVSYYRAVCESIGLNPLTKPFDYLLLGGRLVLYANKGCCDQLRKIHGISITSVATSISDGIYEANATATSKDGRQDVDLGAVAIKGLGGEALANARKKAVTQAKRRVTLSICGLGMLDETEVEQVPDAIKVDGEAVPQLQPQAPKMDEHQWAMFRKLVGQLESLGISRDALRAKMADLTDIDRSTELTPDQAQLVIDAYVTWLAQVEEDARSKGGQL